MNSYLCLPSQSDDSLTELIVVPGRRKYWKWQDFGIADSDAVMIVVKPRSDGSSHPNDLITWLVHAISFGKSEFVIIINNIANITREILTKFEENIRQDFSRVVQNNPLVNSKFFTLPSSPSWIEMEALKTYINTIEESSLHSKNGPEPFTLSINVIHLVGEDVVVGGKVLSGSIQVGDNIHLMPSGIPLTIQSIHIVGNQSVDTVSAGQVIGIRFSGISQDHVSTGMVLVGGGHIGKPTRRIEARINFFNVDFIVREGFCPVISVHCFQSPGKILDIDTESKTASLGETVDCTISFNKTGFMKVFDPTYSSVFGRLVVRQENIIVGSGIIRRIVDS